MAPNGSHHASLLPSHYPKDATHQDAAAAAAAVAAAGASERVLKVLVPNAGVGVIIGKAGATIKDISGMLSR